MTSSGLFSGHWSQEVMRDVIETRGNITIFPFLETATGEQVGWG